MRQRQLHAIESSPLPQIEMVERASAHAHDRAPRRRHRIRRLFVAEHANVTMFVESDGFHRIFIRGASPLGLPYTVARGDPGAPLRSRGSFAALTRVIRGASPSDSPTRALPRRS